MPKSQNLQKSALSFLKKIKTIQMLAVLLIVAAFLIGVLYTKVSFLEKNQGSPTASTEQLPSDAGNQPQIAVNIKDVDIKNEPYIGDANAPIVMAYWLDFQCPFCKQFETQTLPTLIEKYVNSGKLKIVLKDFQFLGEDSQTAGIAENAVWEAAPGSYQAWHEAMYKNQDGENSGWGKKEDIIEMTRSIPGIDADQVSALMDQKKEAYQKELDDDKQEGSKFGVSGTPGFVIGNQSISGAQPTSTFTQVIDSLLEK